MRSLLYCHLVFAHFIVCLHDVGTLDKTFVICAFKVGTSHRTS